VDLSLYATPGPLTSLADDQATMVLELTLDPQALCRGVQGLLVLPKDAFGSGLSAERLAERNTRPAGALLRRATELDPSPLDHPRAPGKRVVGTCRHFAVLATAFLRAAGVPARARCGFASYFVPERKVDHWITEYWSNDARRWVRIDPEILDSDLVERPHDLRPGEFLSGGEAWQLVRAGDADATEFGVSGTENWGPGEIRGNAIRDLAALNRVEMLPWDEWGPIRDSYEGNTGEDFDRLIDELATGCAGEDNTALRELYEGLAVPDVMIR
jgi:hypothetical protein